MKLMATKIIRHIKIFTHLSKINFLTSLEYRINFITLLIPTGLYSAGYLFFLKSIISKIPVVAGWDFNMLLLLFAGDQFIYYAGWYLFRDSLRFFTEGVKHGDFDQVLKLPVNARFISSFRHQQAHNLLAFLIPIIICVYASRLLNFTPWQLLIFFISLLLGLGIMYNLFFIIASLSFWITETEDVEDLFDETSSLSKYPAEVFPRWLAFIFIFIFPLLVVAYIPTAVLLNKLNVLSIIICILMFFITFILSQKIWHAGLRRYSSASS